MRFLKRLFSEFIDDDCTTMAAALAYYTLFALPPLLLVMISVLGTVWGRKAAAGKIQAQIHDLIGSGAAHQIGTMIQSAGQHNSSGTLGMALGLVGVLFGATTAFAQLQAALNRVWHVADNPDENGARSFLMRRLLSFLMVIGVAILMLASLALSTMLTSAGGAMASRLPGWISHGALRAMDVGVSFIVIAVLIAAIYKVLPDADLKWKQVRLGALITAGLFTAGKYLIGLYLGKSGAASAYGAAGSLVLIVLWIYYSSLIVLLGAEFTRVWAETHGQELRTKEGAVHEEREVTREPVPERH